MAERPISEQMIFDIKVNYEKAIQGIANYNTKIDELKVKQRALKDAIMEGAISEQEYQKAMAATKEEMKVYKDGVRVLSKEIQNNIKQEKEQKDSLVALRAQLSNLTRSYDLLTKAEREGAKGKELQKKINAITEEIKNAEAETQRFYRNVGNYENAIKNALGLNNNFANSIMAMKNAGGGDLMKGATSSVKAFGSTLTGLLTNPAFIALAGITGVGVAFKWFFDYNKGIAEATRLTREFTGLTGDALEDVRNSIQATADTFGKDYTETLQAVDSLMSQYNLSASDAIKIINDGFVAGADFGGDMLGKIQQFGPSFRDAGIAADEMVAIIAQTRSGIFSEGGLNLIQTANTRIRQMSTSLRSSLDAIGMSAKQVEEDLRSGSKSTFDIVQEISARLKELPQDSAEVGNVLKDVFGKTAANEGLKMIESLDTMTTKMEDVKKVTGEYGEMQEEQLAANKELNDVMSALFDQSQNGFETMIGHIKIIATKWLVAAIKAAIGFANSLIDVYNESMVVRGIIQVIAYGFKELWTTAKMALNLIVDGVKAAGRSLRGLAYILEGIVTFNFSKVKEGYLDFVTAIPKGLVEMGKDVYKAGKETASNFADGWNNTINNKPLQHIELATGAGVMESEGITKGGGTGGGSGSSGGSDKGSAAKTRARAAEQNTKAVADAMKRQQEEVRKAEELMLQLIEESYEKQRQTVIMSYDKKIADIKARLTTEKNLTEATYTAMRSQITALEQLKQRDLAKLSDEQLKKRVELSNKEITAYLAAVRKGSIEEYNLKVQQMQNNMALELSEAERTISNEEDKQSMLAAIRAKYAQQQKQLNDELSKAEEDAIRKRWEMKTNESVVNGNDPYPELTQLRNEIAMREELLANARQMETESTEEFNARQLQMQAELVQQKKDLADKEVAIQTGKAQAIASAIGALSGVAEAFAEQDEGLAKMSKILALAEIAINTGVALSAGVKQAQSVPFPGNIAAIATTVATILANIATAIKTVKSAKFATGGKVEGEGTGTSDSVPAMLSNGESVMTARATDMFAPLLSVMNQMGGGVPIPGNGMDLGAASFADAMGDALERMPQPVVAVEEINRVQRNVSVIETNRIV